MLLVGVLALVLTNGCMVSKDIRDDGRTYAELQAEYGQDLEAKLEAGKKLTQEVETPKTGMRALYNQAKGQLLSDERVREIVDRNEELARKNESLGSDLEDEKARVAKRETALYSLEEKYAEDMDLYNQPIAVREVELSREHVNGQRGDVWTIFDRIDLVPKYIPEEGTPLVKPIKKKAKPPDAEGVEKGG